jgi:hypothetical protein
MRRPLSPLRDRSTEGLGEPQLALQPVGSRRDGSAMGFALALPNRAFLVMVGNHCLVSIEKKV